MAHSEIVWGATVQECRAAGWDLMRRMAEFVLEESAKRYVYVTEEVPDKKGKLRKKKVKRIETYTKQIWMPMTPVNISDIHLVRESEWHEIAIRLGTTVKTLDRTNIVYACGIRFDHKGD